MNKLNLLSDVRQKLRTEAYRNLPNVALGSGVPESTIKKIRSGEVKDPRVSTVQALYEYFLQASESPHEQPNPKKPPKESTHA